ncbi:AsnC family transcriptional regulator [Thermodesulfobacteriota bacterium]
MDDLDRAILNDIQSGFPVAARPFLEVGRRFNLMESEVLERIERLKKEGVIRRIGGNFDSGKLHFQSTLCAAKVTEKKLDHFVRVVNRYPGVTHNYLRRHDYNVWFTFIAPTMSDIVDALKEIGELTGVKDILNLPAIRKFKIRVDFEV